MKRDLVGMSFTRAFHPQVGKDDSLQCVCLRESHHCNRPGFLPLSPVLDLFTISYSSFLVASHFVGAHPPFISEKGMLEADMKTYVWNCFFSPRVWLLVTTEFVICKNFSFRTSPSCYRVLVKRLKPFWYVCVCVCACEMIFVVYVRPTLCVWDLLCVCVCVCEIFFVVCVSETYFVFLSATVWQDLCHIFI